MTSSVPANVPAAPDSLASELSHAAEAAALAASLWIGLGDEQAADHAAQTALHGALSHIAMTARVVIGEGSKDQTSLFYAGERIGTQTGPDVDLAVDPLEGSNITASGGPNALSVVACAQRDGLLAVPDVYMEKIAVGPNLPDGIVALDAPVQENLSSLARAKNIAVADVTACILNRPRHEELIARVREAGARVMLISDGDMSGIIATALPETGVDIYLGTGGAPEGILAAAALRCIGAQMQARLQIRDQRAQVEAERLGIADGNRIYTVADLVRGHALFAAAGVTDGALLRGVRRGAAKAWTQTLILSSFSRTVRQVASTYLRPRSSPFSP